MIRERSIKTCFVHKGRECRLPGEKAFISLFLLRPQLFFFSIVLLWGRGFGSERNRKLYTTKVFAFFNYLHAPLILWPKFQEFSENRERFLYKCLPEFYSWTATDAMNKIDSLIYRWTTPKGSYLKLNFTFTKYRIRTWKWRKDTSYWTYRIYNTNLDRDWFFARKFVTQSARDHVGVGSGFPRLPSYSFKNFWKALKTFSTFLTKG